ncbi:hypothetical protein MLD38_034833 [Melastoma candidum]|uniref:Uncharacterized protein n=1 Tax=Melastoma candidum TaxID=119954 RepID=A0ACB9MB76_9MYRT|nr:hypothetical protein MLD38_034833 [Melastoma candidum]
MPSSDKVKILYSHGGRILPLPPNRLSYVGGQTKLLSLDRHSATLPLLLSRLPTLPNSFSLKYQLPGLDLDALVSLVDHHDFIHMLYEYDCACSSASSTHKSPRLRLFLFPAPPESTPAALSINPDYLFGLDDTCRAGNSVGSDASPVDGSIEIFEDLVGGQDSKPLDGPAPAMVPQPARITVPMQMSSGYHHAMMMQPVTGPTGSAYYAMSAAPVAYYDGGRYLAGDSGHQYNPTQVMGYDGAGVQRLYYVFPQQSYHVGVGATGGVVGTEAEAKGGVGLAPLPQASPCL